MKRLTNYRGSILVMSIFFMVVLYLTASAFLVLLPVESRAANRSENQALGGFIADSGVADAISWLRYQLAPPDGSHSKEPMASNIYPSASDRTQEVGGGWSFRWELIPDEQTYPNGSNPIRAYTIVSTAYRDGVAVREARAEAIQESLAKYAALFNTWPDNLVWPISRSSEPTGGPVHVNDVLRLWIEEGNGFWGSNGDPVFSHDLTASGSFSGSPDGFAYYKGNWQGTNSSYRPYDSNGPITSRYNRMAAGGRDAMIAGSDPIELPNNTFALRDAAWGFETSTPVPTTPGIHFNEINGKLQGIYIEGDVEEMELGYGGSEPAGVGQANYGNNSWIKVEQPRTGFDSIDTNKNYTVITLDENQVILPAQTVVNGQTLSSAQVYPVDTTLVRYPDGSYNAYPSELNGVVYVNGDVQDLWGTNKGRRTITVEGDRQSTEKHYIAIGGKENDSNGDVSVSAGEKGLLQYNLVDEDGDGVWDVPKDAQNALGLVARDVYVSSSLQRNGNWSNVHPSSNPLYLFALVIGGINGDGGTYSVQSYQTGGAGWAYRYGSRIVVDAGPWGTTSGNGFRNGNTFFDPKAAQAPPPYFPAAPTFVVKSYSELPVMTRRVL